jgi:hypothetical protein
VCCPAASVLKPHFELARDLALQDVSEKNGTVFQKHFEQGIVVHGLIVSLRACLFHA